MYQASNRKVAAASTASERFLLLKHVDSDAFPCECDRARQPIWAGSDHYRVGHGATTRSVPIQSSPLANLEYELARLRGLCPRNVLRRPVGDGLPLMGRRCQVIAFSVYGL